MDALPCLPNRSMQLPALIPKAEPQGENAETCLNARVMLLPHNNLDGGDRARLMSTNSRTCSCCASELFQICGRQAILLDSVSSGRPDACGVELDYFAIFPCQHSNLLSPDVLPHGVSGSGSCVVSWFRLSQQCPNQRDEEIVDPEDSSNPLRQAFAAAHNH